MMITRTIQEKVEKKLFQGKIIVIYGARRVGKTTLVKKIQEKYPQNIYFNCDEPDIREAFENKTSTQMKAFLKNANLVILDEAQRVKNIGLSLKILIDSYPDLQIIATGSSSFDLSNEIVEPLTGRHFEFLLLPFSLKELGQVYDPLEIDRLLEQMMTFGGYPQVVLDSLDQKEKTLKKLSSDYSYRDALAYQDIKNPLVLRKLLQALALQLGNEVSFNELAQTVGIDKVTATRYVEILEKAFIIFRLNPFSRNLRNELKKKGKVYFFDIGVRNALINNFNPPSLRNDRGALWENFLINERFKHLQGKELEPDRYFWRKSRGGEVDYLEESGGKISAFEFKWKKDNFSPPKAFSKAYPESSIELINRNNYPNFILPEE